MKHVLQGLTACVLLTASVSCTKNSPEADIEKLNLNEVSTLSAMNNSSGCVEAIDINSSVAADPVPTVLGAPLNGQPFSVTTMRQAADNLYGHHVDVTVTHRYVRFRPANDDQLEVLINLYNVDLFDYPLDRDVITEGDYYPQPGIGENEMPWFYAVVPSVFNYPAGITYEALQELYLSHNTDLEKEALRITNNSTTDMCGGSSMSSSMVAMGEPVDDGPRSRVSAAA